MKKKQLLPVFAMLMMLQCCRQQTGNSSNDLISGLDLKKGEIITCSPAGFEYGTVEFEVSCSKESRDNFNLAVKLLHSFEYEEAEKAFAKVIDADPGCAMAYWGIAMSNFHPLWTPPTPAEMKKGVKAIALAKSFKTSEREAAYINALGAFYHDWENTGHIARCLNFEQGMEKVYKSYPEDKEAAVFYALALDAAADLGDKSYSKQKKAGEILNALYPGEPNHPGIVHYIIHVYDYPELAQYGLEAARKYASIAPASAHALHMPSHIFTRLGLWDECIRSNLASVASAQCYAEAAGIKGHWDEELHGLDYVVYAYLQKGENDSAKKQLDYLETIREIYPANFKVAYAFAAIPSRYVLENRMWEEAANLTIVPASFPWQNFPWQEAIFHFTRLMGAAHTGKPAAANEALQQLNRIRDTLTNRKDSYSANQVAIQIKTGEAWMQLAAGKNDEALTLMQLAADMEDKTGKHPVTPGEVLPARELLGDMLLQVNEPAKALEAYKLDLQTHPNRFNALYGAAVAAEKAGDAQTAGVYFQQLTTVIGSAGSNRIEAKKAKQYSKMLSQL